MNFRKLYATFGSNEMARKIGTHPDTNCFYLQADDLFYWEDIVILNNPTSIQDIGNWRWNYDLKL